MTTGGKSYYYLSDALGSVLALADETGAKVNEYRYSPRGVDGVFTEMVSQPYRYADGLSPRLRLGGPARGLVPVRPVPGHLLGEWPCGGRVMCGAKSEGISGRS
ncbi:hypothetical protein ACIO3O_35655 [Streptomyces sp. NPDC087440]|uniref:hypothetical protein n=1 Tax=Streptomyces sp. NPDC087440 TaxID=3365790 RepID=UPI003808F467